MPSDGSTLSSQTTIITGTTTVNSSVTLTDNDQPSAMVTSDASGAFQVQVTLMTGQNHLTAQASNPCGTSGVSEQNVTVTLPPVALIPIPSGSPIVSVLGAIARPATDNAGNSQAEGSSLPALTMHITSPDNHATTSKAAIFVTGTTNLPATESVIVNGLLDASLDTANETFNVSVPLKIGNNVIRVIANANGQSEAAQVSVTRTAITYRTPGHSRTWGKIAILASVTALLATILIRTVQRGRRK